MRKHFDATILKKSGAANKKKTSISWIERLDAGKRERERIKIIGN